MPLLPEIPDEKKYDGLFCDKCGYNLTGLTRPQCPECGHELVYGRLLDKKYHTKGLAWLAGVFFGLSVIGPAMRLMELVIDMDNSGKVISLLCCCFVNPLIIPISLLLATMSRHERNTWACLLFYLAASFSLINVILTYLVT